MKPLRQVNLGQRHAELHWRDDEVADFFVAEKLGDYPDSLIDRLRHWAATTPDQLFIARRKPSDGQWLELTYAEAWARIQHISSALLKKGLGPENPIAILSGNSIEHALLGLAAMSIGVPYAPISPQYSLISSDYSKLKHVINILTPGLIFADSGSAYSKAIEACVDEECEVVVVSNPISSRHCQLFDELERTHISPDLFDQIDTVGPNTIAKFLFSSGSTGMPKAVINTQRMLCSNQQMAIQSLPFLANPPPVIVDWLPWNHTFGGNHNLGLVIYNGGSYYIDDSKPTPKDFAISAENLKAVAPTLYFNVPKGYEELVKALRQDADLRVSFFSRVQMLFYAGAGISQPVWDALEELALETCGERILIVTGLGCTETAPSSLFTTGDGGFAGWIGLPVSGASTKLVRTGNKTEIRIKGDHVTPGYWREPELTANAFDEEGYFCTGDAIKFTDDNDIQRGLVFDGRISEDFKLDTGTWVSAGPLREKFLNHFGSIVKDVVIVGRDKAYVSALVFPDFDICRSLELSSSGNTDIKLSQCPLIKQLFQEALTNFAKLATGSASKIVKLYLLVDPPSLDKHEITDKGSLNASAVQDVRSQEVSALYDAGSQKQIISLTSSKNNVPETGNVKDNTVRA